MSDCPRYSECANADAKCHLCRSFSHYKQGNRSQAKGARNERKVIKHRDTAAHLRPASGAMAHAQGDIIDLDALHECKDGYGKFNSRGAKSMTIQRGWLLGIERQALPLGKLPILDIHFTGAPDDEQWSIVRASTLYDLLAENRKLKRQLEGGE